MRGRAILFGLAVVAISLLGLFAIGCLNPTAKEDQVNDLKTQVAALSTQLAQPSSPTIPGAATDGSCLQEVRSGQLEVGDRLFTPSTSNLVETFNVVGKQLQIEANAATGPHVRFFVDTTSVVRTDQVADPFLFSPADGQALVGRLTQVVCGEVPVLHLLVSWFDVCHGDGVATLDGEKVRDLFSQGFGYDACNIAAVPEPR